jgi:lipopolysaccharide transport system ATP-binding protein
MSNKDIVIKVENISKRYRIGIKDQLHDSIGASILSFIKSPLSNYRKYRSLYIFNDIENENRQERKSDQIDIIWALRDVSFEVKRGNVLGIIGDNGAGKSTLLKILCGITDPTSGYAEMRGRISSLLEVGTGFHQELTGRENVYLNGTILGMKKVEVDRKFDEIVEFSGVEKFIDTPVKRYSSGMRVRLAFSVAAHLEPEIMIIDEVLAVGDAAFQQKCLTKMEDVGREGRTVLFVSHNMPAVIRLCERAILLDKGSILAQGPSQEIVGLHLKSGSDEKGTREWSDPLKAPGNDIARLRGVRVVTIDGQINDSIDIRKEFMIEMDYDILKPGLAFMPQFGFLNEEGLLAFITVDQDKSWRKKPRPIGRYTSTVFIPGNLLSEGTLYCNCALRIINPDRLIFNEKNVVRFMIYDTQEGDSARGDYGQKFYGVVRPLLKWSTRFDSSFPAD